MLTTFTTNVKRIFVCLSISLILSVAIGQNAERAPGILPADPHKPKGISEADAAKFVPQTDAMWDLQFSIDVSTPSGSNDLVAAYFFNNEFLVAGWTSDSISRFDASGNYLGKNVIVDTNGVSVDSIRAFTSDGTMLYLAKNTSFIYEVDPAADSVVNLINASAAGFPIRFATYDSTADSGAGGFWVGNFNTAIVLLSKTGTILNSIPANTHGLSAMYSAVVDNFSDSGPYLWVFHQGGSTSLGIISQVKLPAGTQTGIERDVALQLALDDDLAGGIFISDEIVSGQVTLGGVLQAADDLLFGYELDFVPLDYDLRAVDLVSSSPYFQTPDRLIRPFNVSGSLINQGQMEIPIARVNLEINSADSTYFTATQAFPSLQPGNNFSYVLGPFTLTQQGEYEIVTWGDTGTPSDQAPENDTAKSTFIISDSVLARDNGISNGGGYLVNASDATPAYAVTVYEFAQATFLKGVEITLTSPQHGEITYPIIVATSGSGAPMGGPALVGDTVVLDSNINVYYMQFPDPIPIPAGSQWGIGVYEDLGGIFLAQSNDIFTPNVNFFSVDATANPPSWNASGIPTARFIRPIIASCSVFGLSLSSTPDNSSTNGTAVAVVSNSSGTVSYQWNDPANQTADTAVGLASGTYTVTVSDQNGCSATDSVTVGNNTSIDRQLAAGIEQLNLYPNPSSDIFTLELKLNRPQSVSWVIYDLHGRMIKSVDKVTRDNFSEKIDLSYLPKGMYKLSVITEEGEAYKSLFLK